MKEESIMRDCKRCQDQMCKCIRGVGVAENLMHFKDHMRPLRYELSYDTLERGAWLLCLIGECDVCGGRLCGGLRVGNGTSLETALEAVRGQTYRTWRCGDLALPAGKTMCDAMADLFHEEDRPRVKAWLEENPESMGGVQS